MNQRLFNLSSTQNQLAGLTVREALPTSKVAGFYEWLKKKKKRMKLNIHPR